MKPEMPRANRALILALMISTATAGCQQSLTVADYRPGRQTELAKAPESEVFILWRWTPVESSSAVGGKQPLVRHAARQFPVEVVEAFAEGGEAVGFYRRDGRLIAIAGGVEKQLDEAHYTWKVEPGTGLRKQAQENDLVNGVAFVFEVALVIVLLPVGLFLMANPDMSDFDSGNSGNNQGNPSRRSGSGGGSQHPPKPKHPTSSPAT